MHASLAQTVLVYLFSPPCSLSLISSISLPPLLPSSLTTFFLSFPSLFLAYFSISKIVYLTPTDLRQDLVLPRAGTLGGLQHAWLTAWVPEELPGSRDVTASWDLWTAMVYVLLNLLANLLAKSTAFSFTPAGASSTQNVSAISLSAKTTITNLTLDSQTKVCFVMN